MRTQDELWAEIYRLFDAGRREEAEAVLERIEPVSMDWSEVLHNAPIDDEPLTPTQLERLEAADQLRQRASLARLKTG